MRSGREIVEEFRRVFGGEPKLYRAPGRVNVIGEHTDYNDGFVLPAALELATFAAVAPRTDRKLRVRSLLMNETLEFDLDDGDPQPRKDWSDYVRGVALMLERAGHRLAGIDMLVDSNVPVGSGLSSSAALEVAAGYALLATTGIAIDLTALALTGQRAENEFVGMRCGIMDQFIACHGAADRALLIDCRSLDSRLVPIDPKARLLICNTMVHHEHVASEYNARRRDCERGVEILKAVLPGIRALRDVTPADLERHAGLLPDVIHRRCRHVVTENDRTTRAAVALEAGDLALTGRLMSESHASMRDDFEITVPEVDRMVELNAAMPGVFGARMTGGGFGGCTISLVEAGAVDRFNASVGPAYQKATGLTPVIFASAPWRGCRHGGGVSGWCRCSSSRSTHHAIVAIWTPRETQTPPSPLAGEGWGEGCTTNLGNCDETRTSAVALDPSPHPSPARGREASAPTDRDYTSGSAARPIARASVESHALHPKRLPSAAQSAHRRVDPRLAAPQSAAVDRSVGAAGPAGGARP